MSHAAHTTASATNLLTSPEGFRVWRPGTIAYRDALACQDKLVSQRHSWPFDVLILLEHPTVVTLGRNSNAGNLLWSQAELEAAGIECVASRRGGDVTLHAPGQLVGYPIVDLNHYRRDLHRFLRHLEAVLIDTLADFGLIGRRISEKTGVWIAERKIASIGIAVQRWISYHGFALNINNDLSAFEAIVPCGLSNVAMTSMQQELGRTLDMNEVAEAFIHHFGRIMQRPYLGEFDDSSSAAQT